MSELPNKLGKLDIGAKEFVPSWLQKPTTIETPAAPQEPKSEPKEIKAAPTSDPIEEPVESSESEDDEVRKEHLNVVFIGHVGIFSFIRQRCWKIYNGRPNPFSYWNG